MSMNIKDPETHDLARKVAKETGETITEAVNVALRERLDRLHEHRRKKKRLAALMEIGRQGAKMFPGPHIDHAELLYDENGLPK
jgi:antitoxin VapB